MNTFHIRPESGYILSVCGPNDKNIRFIEKIFNVVIYTHNENLTIKGGAQNTKQAISFLNDIQEIVSHKGSFDSEDLTTLANLYHNGNADKENLEFSVPEEFVFQTKNSYTITPKNKSQIELWKKINENDIVFSIGPAGTGKTYMAVAIAINELLNNRIKKIILARPAVETGENLGFLPGDFKEKIAPFLRPLYDALSDMLPRESLKRFMEDETIEVIPLAYMRGRTLNNGFIILDEAQNATMMQMKMFLTRIGKNSKSIVTGDITQIDLNRPDKSGLLHVQKVLSEIKGISFVYSGRDEVVRHKLVKDIIEAYENEKKD